MSNYFGKQVNDKIYKPSIEEHKDKANLHLNENSYTPAISAEFINSLLSFEYNIYERNKAISLRNKLAQTHGVDCENILISNGSSEILKHIFISIKSGSTILLPSNTWAYYPSLVKLYDFNAISYDLICNEENNVYCFDIDGMKQEIIKNNPALVVITSPNAFTGNLITSKQLAEIANVCSHDTLLIIDQAYIEFSYKDDIRISNFIEKYPNIIFSRTFSKFYGLANIRVGYAISNIKNIDFISKHAPIFEISGLSQKIALEVLNQEEHYADIKTKIVLTKNKFIKDINALKYFEAYESEANFVLIRILELNASKVKNYILKKGFLLGDCSKYGLDDYIRVTIGKEGVMYSLIATLNSFENK